MEDFSIRALWHDVDFEDQNVIKFDKDIDKIFDILYTQYMIAHFLQKLRKRHGMTQEYLASVLSMSRPTYLQIEHGERELTMPEIKKLIHIFDVSLTDFFAEKEGGNTVVTLEKKQSKTEKHLSIRVTEKSLKKFTQVLLYILNKVGGKPNIGETVLHKLLYFIDFDYYEKYEENLMGATYIKNHHGPTSIELSAIIKEMEENGELEIVKSKYFKYEQKKYLARKRPNLTLFSAREIEHIDSVLARLSDKNAKEIEQYSHDDIPWKSAVMGKPISYESVFYRDERYSVRNYDDAL
jgi:transcriptional regulator with XRE-family HTH domain